MIYLQLLSDFFLRKFLRLYIFLFSPLAYFGLSQCIFGMFLSRIFSSLSPYQGQKLCFLTFLNIKSDFSPPLFYKARLLPPKPRFLRRFFLQPPKEVPCCFVHYQMFLSKTSFILRFLPRKFYLFFYFSACRGHFLPSRDFYRTNFQSIFFANGDSYRKKRPLRLSPAA